MGVFACCAMGSILMFKAFRVHASDNVATMLTDGQVGSCQVLGGNRSEVVHLAKPIPVGHKVCLRAIDSDDEIIKYGIAIGTATEDLQPGQHVHLHNCQSNFDTRSASLNMEDGSPTDTPYE